MRSVPVLAASASLALAWVPGLAETARADDAPACRVSAETVPRSAVVGEQIVYRARIVRREDVERVEWEVHPSFPGFRAEWLPGRAEDTEMHYRGRTFVAREEHRALFATRPGELVIPEAAVRCILKRRGPRPPESQVFTVPSVRVRVLDPPARGRPPRWSGLIGPVSVHAVADPVDVRLGESVRVSVMLRGSGNLWSADPPYPEGAIPAGAELFAKPPELELEVGERLQVRRFFRFDLVPRAEGSVELPGLHIPYYDPKRGRYAVADAPPIRVRVRGRPAASAPARPKGDRRRAAAPASRADAGAPREAWLAAAALVVAVSASAWLWHWRRRRWRPVEDALDEAGGAAGAGDPVAEAAALARALRAALATVSEELAGLDPAELRARGDPPLEEVAAQLDALAWLRFSGEMGHPDRKGARTAIERLRRKRVRAPRYGSSS